ncbi:MarR family transcriptional regulator [Methanolobus sp. ZRKC3]|uniref:MarR family transcriptional regulator n=1 Tax=Methanolobus sp. ZRKC3 TaxID=3125786 RepID=UPI003254D7F9
MTKEYAEQLFLQEKPALALLAIWSLQKTYASIITKEINSTFAHTTKILTKMEEHGLVKFSLEGRVKYVELTEHGYKVVEALKALIIALEGDLPENDDESKIADEKMEDVESEKANIVEKVDKLHDRISSIYEDNADVDAETIKRKIGPFSRDIQLLLNSIEDSGNILEDSVLDKFTEIQGIFDSVMNQ